MVRPVKVAFYDPASKKLAREIKVWTEAGRATLVMEYDASREGLASLEDEIWAQLAERDGRALVS